MPAQQTIGTVPASVPAWPWWQYPLYWSSDTSTSTVLLHTSTTTGSAVLVPTYTTASSSLTYGYNCFQYYLPPLVTQPPLRADERSAQPLRPAEALRHHAPLHRLSVGEERALALLRTHLDADQWAQFERERAFVVRAGKRRFRIRWGIAGNVEELDGECEVAGVYCCHPRAEFELPVPDVLLAQALHIQDDLEGFLHVANRHR